MLSTNSALATIDRKAKLIVTSQRQSNCSDRKDEVEIRKAKRETLALLGGARVSEFSLEPLGPATPIHCRKITVVRVIWISLSDLKGSPMHVRHPLASNWRFPVNNSFTVPGSK